jgi:hypothetical protein
MLKESNPNASAGDNGVDQWGGERQQELTDYAKSSGSAPEASMASSQGFLTQELNGSGGGTIEAASDAGASAASAAEASAAFDTEDSAASDRKRHVATA